MSESKASAFSWYDPGVSPVPPHAQIWGETPEAAMLTKDQRDRQIYRVAAEVAGRIAGVSGWRMQRSGVCVGVWIGPERYRHRRADYDIWVENTTDQHLHKPPFRLRSEGDALDRIAAILRGECGADEIGAITEIVRGTGREIADIGAPDDIACGQADESA